MTRFGHRQTLTPSQVRWASRKIKVETLDPTYQPDALKISTTRRAA